MEDAVLIDVSWVEIATIVGSGATALAAAIALIAGLIAYWQIKEQRKLQGMATARSLYRSYLADAPKRPAFFEPDYSRIVAEKRAVEYGLFIAHMLYALEEILRNTISEEWRHTVRAQLQRHADYFSSEAFPAKRGHYHPELLDLVDQVISSSEASGIPAEVAREVN